MLVFVGDNVSVTVLETHRFFFGSVLVLPPGFFYWFLI